MEENMCKYCKEDYANSTDKDAFKREWLEGGYIECGDCWSISIGKA